MTRRPRNTPDTSVLHAMLSILLHYPDQRVLSQCDAIAAALGHLGASPARAAVAGFLGWLDAHTPAAAAETYVTTFDLARRRSLHLTYYRHGDTRARGMALLTLKHLYRRAGYPAPDSELPDFLPLILEFTVVDPDTGHDILSRCRDGLELLTDALHDIDSPYAPLLDTVRDTLPTLPAGERQRLRALAADGPPSEQVGLEPFAPPEYLTGTPR
ncbi:nitrate reductase molybdenum cofactor assembly chaperone [Nocardia terpenica]|uniref:Nitrate reductase molybdenum cofactor assembly chaperone n=1 Tax=Nocardia terpenica TaxID=455432 RepID=A0A6G9Z482_9NOCA|nr:nitrate reductase molybdenum cofactor assembly chaperone [Nocardia terpenica]QIS20201.1 nitrate reductase molybdenum cofactor assembly chaperone [Nocardia terpenica]